MKHLNKRFVWTLASIVALLAVAGIPVHVQAAGGDPPPTSTKGDDAASVNTTIVVEDPSLHPAYGPICETFWYRFSNNRGHYAYLTLNTNQSSQSTNWATWRPNLPWRGRYKVQAYIATHGPIDWPCPSRHIGWDTTDARYTIYHANGSTTVSGNQKPLYDQWLDLGTYIFNAGTSGYVKLTDLNGEANLSHTVSFSAVRFQYLDPPPTTGIVGGVVTSKSSGKKIAGARVSIGGKVQKTNSQGQYSIGDLPAGKHTLRVSAGGYYSYKGSVTVIADASVTRNVRLAPVPSNGYYLPYPGGKTYKCTQGNNQGSHTGNSRYAFDFGTGYNTLVASRGGRVVAVRTGRGHCGTWPYCSRACVRSGGNYVIIRHSDGTDTAYFHMSKVYVRRNQWVSRGQSIGKSGNTGCTTGPHVHFVRRKSGTYRSVKTSFKDAGVPRTGRWYRSKNYRTLSSLSLTQTITDTEPPWAGVQLRMTGQPTYTLDLWAADYVTDVVKVRLADSEVGLSAAPWLTYSETATQTYVWTQPEVFVQFQDANGNVSEVVSDTLESVSTMPIQPQFAVSPTVCVGQAPSLTNQTVPLCEQCGWDWDFGNGFSSREIEPSFEYQGLWSFPGYAVPGTYTITLTVANADSVRAVSHQIEVLPAPSPLFTLTRSGTTIHVQAQETDAADWFWNFGDGITLTATPSATHVYTTALWIDQGIVPVQLTVQGKNGCSASWYQYVPPTYHVYLPLTIRRK